MTFSSKNPHHPSEPPADAREAAAAQGGERPQDSAKTAAQAGEQTAEQAEPSSGEEVEAAARAASKTGLGRFVAGLILASLGCCGFAAVPVNTLAGTVCLVLFAAGLALMAFAFGAARQAPADLVRTAYWVGVREGRAQAGDPSVSVSAGERPRQQRGRLAEAIAAVSAGAPADKGAVDEAPSPDPTVPPEWAAYGPGKRFGGADSLDRLLSHTDDVFGTLRSLVESQDAEVEYRELRQLLQGVGLDEWTDAPKAVCRRMLHSRCFRIGTKEEGLDAVAFDRLIATEGALNQAWLIYETFYDPMSHTPKPVDYRDEAVRAVHNAWRLPPAEDLRDLTGSVWGVYDDPEAALAHSEWGLRVAVADTAEGIRLPFRLTQDHRANADIGLVLIRLEVPRPACFAGLADTPEERIDLAKSYALRTAILMAAGAFRVPAAKRVVVSCHEHGGSRTVLSLQVEAEDLARLQGAAAAQRGWFDDPSVRANFAADGWFGPVEPHLRGSSPELEGSRYLELPELSNAPCSPELQEVAHVRTAADFGINEDAERLQVWTDFSENLPTSAEAAVTRLMELRDAASQAPTAEACDRAIRALAEGSIELSDLAKLRELFSAGTELDRAVEYAHQVADEGEGQDLGPAIQRLEAALSPGMQILYLDDTDTVYRYFDNVAQRVAFNRTAPDDRRVCLVPDIYYRALSMVARLLVLSKRYDDAEVYTDEMIRIAPTAADPVLFKARVLESKSDPFAAAALIRKAAPQALSHRDLGLYLYRLAFFEWKLGHMEQSIACYKAVVDLHVPLSGQAMLEAAQLVAADDSLENLTSERARALMEEEGIPTQVARENRTWMMQCAVRATDQHLYPVAVSLTASAVEIFCDDVLAGVYRSLLPIPTL